MDSKTMLVLFSLVALVGVTSANPVSLASGKSIVIYLVIPSTRNFSEFSDIFTVSFLL